MEKEIIIRDVKINDFDQVHRLLMQVHILHAKERSDIYKDTDPLTIEEFKKEMLKKSKEEIFESAYEITSKEEIKDTLKYMNLHRAEKEMLILQDDILTEFYHDWLDDDTPLGDSMRPCIEESIAVLTKYIGKRFNLKREKDNGEDER